jgi:2-hydroxy-3-keto-5-methylthiopentenyl-1-phosphate phosphatase
MRKLRFYLDFDGTIATADVVDRVLGRFAAKEWEDVEREWTAGRIGSRECLSRQIALVRASKADLAALLDGVGVDPGFPGFLRAASELDVPVTVVSDGFDLFIRPILERALGASGVGLAIHCNSLSWSPSGSLETAFPAAECEHGCATCKPAVIRRTRGQDDFVVFVGDGLSDRHAAAASDLTFAKAKLLDYCVERRIKHRPYAGFHEIEAWLRACRAGQDTMKSLHLGS